MSGLLALRLDAWTLSILGLSAPGGSAHARVRLGAPPRPAPAASWSPPALGPEHAQQSQAPLELQHLVLKGARQPHGLEIEGLRSVPLHEGFTASAVQTMPNPTLTPLAPSPEADFTADLASIALTFESHHGDELPRFTVCARPKSCSLEDVYSVLDVLGRVLDHGQPFTVVWDLRQLKIPPRSVIRAGTDWMGEAENAGRLDQLVQAVVVILKDPLIRAVARW